MENQTNQLKEQPVSEQNSQSSEEEILLNKDKLKIYIEKLKLEQNLPSALIGGSLAAIISAILWAVVTVATGYQIGYMAIAVGFFVGYVVRFTGKGIDKIFGISGAILSIIGCILGNFLSIIGFVANAEGLGYLETLSLIDLRVIPSLMTETFQVMDLLFYGFAIYEGYKFSFRKITEGEILANAID